MLKKRIKSITYLSETFGTKERVAKVLHSKCDIRCKTDAGEYIIVEIQQERTHDFIERMQYYMIKMLNDTMKEGQSAHYEKMPRCYVLVISLANLFDTEAKHEVDDDDEDDDEDDDTEYNKKGYEDKAVPFLLNRENALMNNKMTWKFFEILRFLKIMGPDFHQRSHKLKEQWLHFLGQCADQDQIPDGVHPDIEKAYNKVEATPEQLRNRLQEESNAKQYEMSLISQGKAEGKAEGRALEKKRMLQLSTVKTDILQKKELQQILRDHPEFAKQEITDLKRLIDNRNDCSFEEMVQELYKLKWLFSHFRFTSNLNTSNWSCFLVLLFH